MKSRIAEGVMPADGGRLWTWWRVAGLVVMGVTLATLVSPGCRAQTAPPADTQVAPKEEPQAGEQPTSPDAEAEKLAARYAKAQGVIETNKGTIRLKFFPKEAPRTVHNFAKLANTSFYDNIKFHRYEPAFVIQGGDPNTRDLTPDEVRARQQQLGIGGPGYTIPAEFGERRHVLGTVAMARGRDPNSAGSQFYISLDAAPWLDEQYTIFGEVTLGLETVKKLRVGDVMKRVRVTGIAK